MNRPNLIILLADDLRWNTLGCQGDKIIQTPAIDRLASGGTSFSNAFVTSSICCTSRASILTGQWAQRHGIEDFATPLTPEQWRNTYPALLRTAGYRTGFIGKFGVGDAKAVAAMSERFDYWRGLPGQGGDTFIKDGQHQTARFGDQSLEFLRGCSPSVPFALSVSFNAPHARDGKPREFEPDARDETRYADTTIPPPELARGDAAFQRLPPAVQTSEGRRRWQIRFATPEMYQRTVRDYYRLITGIDREVERIVTRLRESGLLENTVIVFTSDNGFALGERGLADKWFAYEEDIRIPLIVSGPGIKRQKSAAMALNVDIAPTLLDLAGLPVPPAVQGRSLLPLLKGKTPGDWRHEFYYEHHAVPDRIPPCEAVRTERWKYIRWTTLTPPVEELYDLRADSGEERNLIAAPEHIATLSDLRQRWEQYRQEQK
jgi:arylsulfatase A-like enzyme